jgi:hypothetical protein
MNDHLLESKEFLFLEFEAYQRRLTPIIVIIKEKARNHPIKYSFVKIPLCWE